MRIALLTARDPLLAPDAAHPIRLARQLAAAGDEVAIILLEDAVTLARAGHAWSDALTAALEAGAAVLVEEEAAARRAVHRLLGGVKPVELGTVVETLFDTDRQVWM